MNIKSPLFLLPFAGFILGLLFELDWFYFIPLSIIYAVSLFLINKHQRQHQNEWNTFRLINSYMSQVAQSFVRTKNILSSLQETASTFPTGPMQTQILEAIDILLLEGGDIFIAEKKALECIEKFAPCERLHTLHEFMILAEDQGGECQKEFILLEKMRIAWERAMLKYHQTLKETLTITTILYALMLFICVLILHGFPSKLNIIHLPFIQITNCILISLLVLFFLFLDKQLCGQLLRPPSKLDTRHELEAAFPKWLFDLMLLIQRESVESAILHSISTAPEILQPELKKMCDSLLIYPEEITVFTSFLAEYELPQVEMNMRKLYALSIGAEQKEDSINFMIEANMENLMQAEEKRYELKSGLSTLFQLLPMLFVTFAMLIYCVAIVVESLTHIMHLLI